MSNRILVRLQREFMRLIKDKSGCRQWRNACAIAIKSNPFRSKMQSIPLFIEHLINLITAYSWNKLGLLKYLEVAGALISTHLVKECWRFFLIRYVIKFSYAMQIHILYVSMLPDCLLIKKRPCRRGRHI